MAPELGEAGALEVEEDASATAPTVQCYRAQTNSLWYLNHQTWRTTWEPGTRFEYHPSSAHWGLADLIEEVSGRAYADVITERMMEPAGQPRWLAIPESEQGDITDVYCVGEPVDPAEFDAQFGGRGILVFRVRELARVEARALDE